MSESSAVGSCPNSSCFLILLGGGRRRSLVVGLFVYIGTHPWRLISDCLFILKGWR